MIKKKKGSCGKPRLSYPEDRDVEEEEFEPRDGFQDTLDDINEQIRNNPDLSSVAPDDETKKDL